MSNRIFDALYCEKIDIFKNSFSATSTEVFYDPERERLIHAGEYGMYRESVVRDFLNFIVPQRLAISNGFLMSGMDDISTQCDVVIFDSKMTPLYQGGDRHRFFPIESVYCIGEVKSNLSRAAFRDAINKLARNKAIAERIKNPSLSVHSDVLNFDPTNDPFHIYSSILICKKFDFDISNLENELDELYSDEIQYRHRHNMILSIEDGLFAYCAPDGKKLPYPMIRQQNFKNCFLSPINDKYFHMKYFGSFMFMLTSSKISLYPEFTDYISPVQNGGSARVQP
ncbi:DUF6602 domain-containing protein [Citrobacter sedlakii]|uniref:DUF6602 domain-containing protein n=1 Tax=Citrobacter sedlakii TaxID=67826 RepID=UPI003B22A0CA